VGIVALVIFATYWNDMDWLEASLEYLEYWKPDKIYICEGCFDIKYPPRSTDGTYEYLEKWCKHKPNATLVLNSRLEDYFTNQASVCNQVLELSNIQEGDWLLRIDCDHFMFKAHVEIYREFMKQDFDYPILEVYNFWDTTKKYFSKWTDQSIYLPYKYHAGAKIVPVCHLAINGKLYKDIPELKGLKTQLKGFHYEGFRSPERLKQKYDVGPAHRQSPVTWKDGLKLRDRRDYDGPHPEFAEPVLKKYDMRNT
jgi:hypothetical protein